MTTLTRCERHGQIEIGIIEHSGREFVALGASVIGNHVTGYTVFDGRDIRLTTWCGATMLACRTEVVEQYWDGSFALLFRLTRGRFIVGYSLGDGMLFRGELIEDDEDCARKTARQLPDECALLDAEEDADDGPLS